MKPRVTDVITAVCSVFEVTRAAMVGPSQSHKIAHPRQVAMFLARELTDWSFPRIAAELGRDHTTAIHACKRVARRLVADPALPANLDLCRAHVAAITQQREMRWADALSKPLVGEAA